MINESKNKNLHLFVSFDLTNSTRFKYYNKYWIYVYGSVFKYITDNMSSGILKWKSWKMNGDELLFYNDCFKCNDVDKIIAEMDKLMSDCLEQTYNEFDRNNPDTKFPYNNFPDIKQLYIKTTMWLTSIKSFDLKNNLNNIDIDDDFKIESSGIKEFIGKEIDIGFRISKYTPRSKTAISAALLYCLLKQNSSIVNKFHIAGYAKLKGVWYDKKYPIIWYIRSDDHTSILKSFHYDEKDDNKFISLFLYNLERNKKYGLIDKREFENMLDYLGLRVKYDRIF